MSVVHAVYGSNDDNDYEVRLYNEGVLSYPRFDFVGELTSNGDAVRYFGHPWELTGSIGGKRLSIAIPSPEAVGDLFIGCDWPALEADVERRIVDMSPYVDSVIFETRDEYDKYVLASNIWHDGGEGYYCTSYSKCMKKVWYVREFEEMLDIVNDYNDVEVLLDSDIKFLEGAGWRTVRASGKIVALVKA